MNGTKGEWEVMCFLFLLEMAGWPRWGQGIVLLPGGYLAYEEPVDPMRPEG